jgi:uncharacterized protein (TIGR02996 family)
VIALLSDCKENPEDDTPRLVLADWLEERDDPRGSFLRAQVMASRLPELDPERGRLESEAARLLLAHEKEWLGELRPYLGSWEFSRGLVHALAPGKKLLARAVEAAVGREVLAWVESFRLFDAGPHLAKLSRAGILSGVRAISLQYNKMGDAALAGWLDAGNLPLLQELDLFSNNLTGTGVEKLARTPLPELRRLNLGDNNLGPASLYHFAWNGRAKHLEILQLERVGLQEPARTHLRHGAPSGGLPSLHTLDLPDNDLSAAGLEWILTHYHLPPLRRLVLRSARLGDDAVRVLSSLGEQVQQLEWLALAGCALTDAGVEALARCPHLERVRTLVLDGNQLTARSAVALLNSPHLVGLRDLSLQDMMFNAPPDAGALLDTPRLGQLTRLGCSVLRLDPIAAARLLNSHPSLTLE